MEHRRILRKGVDKNNKYIVVTMSLHFYIYYFLAIYIMLEKKIRTAEAKTTMPKDFVLFPRKASVTNITGKDRAFL